MDSNMLRKTNTELETY